MGNSIGLVFSISIWFILTVLIVISFWRQRTQGKDIPWTGGAPVSTQSHIAILAFFLSWGLAAFFHSALAAIACVAAGIAMCFLGICDQRRYRNRLKQTRVANATQYPGVFDQPALAIAADKLPDQPTFRVFDNLSATYLGKITREQLQFLIQWHQKYGTGAAKDFPQTNDIFILEDCLDILCEQGADLALIDTLRQWISKKNDDIELRWIID